MPGESIILNVSHSIISAQVVEWVPLPLLPIPLLLNITSLSLSEVISVLFPTPDWPRIIA